MSDHRSLLERDYALLRNLAVATALAVLLPNGSITRLIETFMVLIVAVLAWEAFTGPRTPPPLTIVTVNGPLEGLRYQVSAPNGDGAHTVDFQNDLDVRVEEVRFACLSPTSGRFELLLNRSFEPHTSGRETVDGQTADVRTACKLKSYETYAPLSARSLSLP